MAADSSPTVAAASAAVTVRGLAPEKARLCIRAAHNARSMEAEARAILEAALAAPEEDATDLASFARGLFGPLGGVELELPPREPTRDPPVFGYGESPAAAHVAAAPSTSAPGATRAKTTGREATTTGKGRGG